MYVSRGPEVKIRCPYAALTFMLCFLLASTGLSAQEAPKIPESAVSSENSFSEENASPGRQYKPRERNLFIDIPLTIAEITAINLLGNFYWRLWGPDSEVAYFTADSMRANMNYKVWTYEEGQGGDTFLVNQFFHPYAGGLYFASARSNNFNFYLSLLSSTFGSLQWEIMGESDSPATNDLINTAFGGLVLGEVLHRLYIELDKGDIGGK